MTDPDRPGEPPTPDRRAMEDFEDVERITRTFVHWSKWSLIVGLPIWLVLLVVVPASGLGAIGSLSLSTLLAAGAVVLAERRLGRRTDPAGEAPRGGARRRRRAPMSPVRAVFLTLVAVVAAIYVIFIIVTILRGG